MHITIENQNHDPATVNARRRKNIWSIDRVFRKYARPKTPFPLLASDPVNDDPGTSEGLGLDIGTSEGLIIGIGWTGGLPLQTLTVRQKHDTQQ